MRPLRTLLPALVAGLLVGASPAAAASEMPRSAAAFHDSVGVTTHIVYYDTAYGDWPRVVRRLEELGVRHLRDGVYGNPAPQWRDWNERYYRAVELAASRGMRFAFGMGQPGNRSGTLDELVGVVAGRLRHAAEALEAPNEFDLFVGGPAWADALRTYTRELYRKADRHPSLRRLPVLGPSLYGADAPRSVGDQRSWLDVGNIHPYTGGKSPEPEHVRSELARAATISGPKPVWATEAGFHNALKATKGQPPTSERAAAVYHVRTFLEHFKSGIARTYAYELIDNKPEPGRRDPEQHFGLLRNDFSPKPAFAALRNLLALVGEDDGRAGVERLRPLRLSVSGGSAVRRLVLQRADGSHIVALWRHASVWDREARRAVRATPTTVRVSLPGVSQVTAADPVAGERRRVALRRGSASLQLGGSPLLLEVGGRSRPR